MKRIAAIHDLSGFGKSSLTVIIPILSALGIQVCPVPTAVLSTQTDGFDGYSFFDLTQYMKEHLNHWMKMGLEFDAVYTGYLGAPEQMSLCKPFIEQQKKANASILIDPVLGDSGALYKDMKPKMVKEMQSFISYADIITPNFTELCLLSEVDFEENVKKDRIENILSRLRKLTEANIIVTSVLVDSVHYNVCYDRELDDIYYIEYNMKKAAYPGTGDMFASILLGKLLCSKDFTYASFEATKIISQMIEMSLNDNTVQREGIFIEKYLDILKGEE